jgi:hypothetical protein
MRNYPAAARAYDEAATLFPGAQSPRLAELNLARIQRRAASPEGLQRVLMRKPATADRNDPWPEYYRGEGRYAETLIDALYKRFSGTGV